MSAAQCGQRLAKLVSVTRYGFFNGSVRAGTLLIAVHFLQRTFVPIAAGGTLSGFLHELQVIISGSAMIGIFRGA